MEDLLSEKLKNLKRPYFYSTWAGDWLYSKCLMALLEAKGGGGGGVGTGVPGGDPAEV